jgi:glutamyl-tRNA synthetase
VEPVPTPVCRFAPSPTGYLHVGSAQSALFNWLFARHEGGRMLLRVEDTDADRNRPELTDNILESLRWLGIEWDGDVVHQSDHLERHREVIERLASSDHAYWCDCTREEIDARNRAAGRPPGYDGFCRDRGLGPGEGRALRFKVPLTGTTSWTDLIRGEVSFENANIDDFVIARSSGAPLFIVANAIDDADMGITHVIRGEDHVNNTAKYLLIWQAVIEREVPQFAHLPLLVNAQRKKLSKRRDDVSVADFRAAGYLGPAMRNYLALLGWGPRDGVEIRPIEEIVEQFRLEDVSPSSAFFDVQKLQHINAHYIRALPVEEFVALAAEFMPEGDAPRAALESVAPLVQERVRTLAEVPELVRFLWEPAFAIPDEVAAGLCADDQAAAMLRAVRERLAEAAWDIDGVEQAVREAAAEVGFVNAEGNVRLSKAQAPVRLALTGSKVGLPLWQGIVAFGREPTVARLEAALARCAA